MIGCLTGNYRDWLASSLAGEGRDEPKRRWKNTGMQWIRKKSDEDVDAETPDSGSPTVDDDQLDNYYEYHEEPTDKRRWKNTGMGWIKRKWKSSGMGWIKRDDDKRKWRNTGMQWVRK